MAKSRPREAEPPADAPPGTPRRERRSFLTVATAVVAGALITLFPFVPGLAMLLDPVLRKKKKEGDAEGDSRLVRVTSLESIPPEGAQQFPVIADRQDAWTQHPNERIGSVYLRRIGENKDQVECFNAVCPHLGCIYSFVASRSEFYCPCHNSAFTLDGERIERPGKVNPSPRPLDRLETEVKENGEVWVKFENFFIGTEEKIPKQ